MRADDLEAERGEESQKIPFQCQTFIDFLGLVGRYFYDDACIVLLDFFARENKSFLETELRDKLGWRDALIQQKLYLLEKHLIVVQDIPPNRGPRAPVHWRINNQIYGAIQWRYQQLLERLTKLVDDAHRQHEFECSKPSCAARYTALQAAGCNRALDDEHPLCTRCGSQLKPSEFEETKQHAKEKRARALQQLQPLGQSLLRMANMQIPIFPAYAKKDDVAEAKTGQEPVQFVSTTDLTTASPAPSLASTVPQSQSTTALQSPITTQDPNPLKSSGKIPEFQIRLGQTAAAISSTRVIPWFKPAGSSQTTTSVAISKLENASQSSTTTASKITFGIKATSKLSALTDLASKKANAAVPLPVNRPHSTTIITNSVVLSHDQSVAPDIEETEMHVKALGRHFKMSEITEEVEAAMDDEEYGVRH